MANNNKGTDTGGGAEDPPAKFTDLAQYLKNDKKNPGDFQWADESEEPVAQPQAKKKSVGRVTKTKPRS